MSRSGTKGALTKSLRTLRVLRLFSAPGVAPSGPTHGPREERIATGRVRMARSRSGAQDGPAIGAAVCPPPHHSHGPKSREGSVRKGAGTLSETDAATLRVLEERLAMPSASETQESLALILAAEFREFGSSGRVFGRASVLEALVAGGRPQLKFEEFLATPVSYGAALVTYVARSVAGPGWKPPSLRSSLWVRRDDRWQMVFHQGTRLAPEES